MSDNDKKPEEGAKADPKDTKEQKAAKPEAPKEPKDNDPGDEAAPESAATKPAKKPWHERRIGELTYNWRQTERDRDYWRDLATRQAAQPAQSVQPQAQAANKPQASQFQSTEEYLEALADWKTEVKLAERERRQREESEKQERERSAQKVHKTFAEREQKAREKYEDFEEVAYNPENPINQVMADVIRRSELGPEIAYFIGKNPDKGLQIAAMTDPHSVALAIGRIEAHLEAASQPPAVTSAPTQPVTKAPPPPKTLSGSAPVQKTEDQETVKEWMARRNQEAKKSRAA